MTIPILILIKAIIEIPLNLASFMQTSMFYLSTGGVIGEYFFAKGWTAPAILVLKTVVDPSISNLGVAIFLLMSNLSYTVANKVMGNILHSNNIKPSSVEYSWVMCLNCTIPCVLCLPFFWIAGKKMV